MSPVSHLVMYIGAFLVASQLSGARAQQSSPGIQIQGRVVRAGSGVPLQGAKVQLMSPGIAGAPDFQTAISGAEGFYEFSGVKSGSYSIVATAEGSVSATYRRGTSVESELQRIGAETRSNDIDFRLEPEATIQGSVVRYTRLPVGAGVSVAAVQKEKREDGSQGLLAVATVLTDGEGRFTLKGLPAGTYLVCVNGPDGWELHPDLGPRYKETWYGSSASVEGATPLSVHEGQQIAGLQIIVEREQRFRVTVRPSGPNGNTVVDRYEVSLQNRNHSTTQMKDGSYLIPDIPPGRYTVVSTAWSGVTYVGQGEAEFQVVDADVTVDVSVGALGEIDGIVMDEGALGSPIPNLMIAITSEEGAAQSKQVTADRSFQFDRVLPGQYTFRLLGTLSDLKIESVRCGGAEVSRATPLRAGAGQRATDCTIRLARY